MLAGSPWTILVRKTIASLALAGELFKANSSVRCSQCRKPRFNHNPEPIRSQTVSAAAPYANFVFAADKGVGCCIFELLVCAKLR